MDWRKEKLPRGEEDIKLVVQDYDVAEETNDEVDINISRVQNNFFLIFEKCF